MYEGDEERRATEAETGTSSEAEADLPKRLVGGISGTVAVVGVMVSSSSGVATRHCSGDGIDQAGLCRRDETFARRKP